MYYMAKLVFRSIRQITHADWLLRSIFYDIDLPVNTLFFGQLSFGGKTSKLI